VTLLSRAFERRSADLAAFDPNRIPGPTEGWFTWTGVPVSERQALRQLTWWACVSLISDSIAQLPIGTFEKPAGEQFPRRLDNPDVIEEPIAGMDRVDWIGRAGVSLLSRGNFYANVAERDRLGYPTQLQDLHPDQIDPRVNLDSGAIEYYALGAKEPLTRREVYHVRGMSIPGVYNVKGLDPIEYARQTIAVALGAQEYGGRYFGESATPSGVLHSDQRIDESTAKEMQARWIEGHAGRNRKPAVLGGGLQWQSIAIAPNESQFLETIDAKRAEIAGFFRVPPHMVGMTEKQTSWGTGVEENGLQFVTYTLAIWLVRLERSLSRFLLPPGQYFKFNVAGLLRGRLLDRYDAYLKGRQGGWLNVDDVRALEDLPPLPDGKGKDYLQSLNYAPVPPGGGPPDIQQAPHKDVAPPGEAPVHN
jgi:HK97 family phage portal protein